MEKGEEVGDQRQRPKTAKKKGQKDRAIKTKKKKKEAAPERPKANKKRTTNKQKPMDTTTKKKKNKRGAEREQEPAAATVYSEFVPSTFAVELSPPSPSSSAVVSLSQQRREKAEEDKKTVYSHKRKGIQRKRTPELRQQPQHQRFEVAGYLLRRPNKDDAGEEEEKEEGTTICSSSSEEEEEVDTTNQKASRCVRRQPMAEERLLLVPGTRLDLVAFSSESAGGGFAPSSDRKTRRRTCSPRRPQQQLQQKQQHHRQTRPRSRSDSAQSSITATTLAAATTITTTTTTTTSQSSTTSSSSESVQCLQHDVLQHLREVKENLGAAGLSPKLPTNAAATAKTTTSTVSTTTTTRAAAPKRPQNFSSSSGGNGDSDCDSYDSDYDGSDDENEGFSASQHPVATKTKSRTPITTPQLHQIVTLNIGGRKFSTLWSTLLKYPENSLLAKIFGSTNWQAQLAEDGSYFIDRDPAYFSSVLNFLRSGMMVWPRSATHRKQLLLECQFYGIMQQVCLIPRRQFCEHAIQLFGSPLHHDAINHRSLAFLLADDRLQLTVSLSEYFPDEPPVLQATVISFETSNNSADECTKTRRKMMTEPQTFCHYMRCTRGDMDPIYIAKYVHKFVHDMLPYILLNAYSPQ